MFAESCASQSELPSSVAYVQWVYKRYSGFIKDYCLTAQYILPVQQMQPIYTSNQHPNYTNYTNNQHSDYQQDVSSPTNNVHSSGEVVGNGPNYYQAKSIFGSNQKHIVLFAYNKQKDENSPQEIMILEQPKKKFKEEATTETAKSCYNLIQINHAEQKLFLKKVDPMQKVEIAEEIKQIMSFSNQLSLQERYQRRKEIFQASKARRQSQRATEEVLANRTIRVVKMDSLRDGGSIRGVVQLGKKPVEYQVLNLNDCQQEYYTLVKKLVRADQVFPQIQMEHNQFLSEISYEPDQPLKEHMENDDDYDSNDSDNPNFDYPDQQDSERSSEGIIPRDFESENQYEEGMIEDEQQVYRRYLRRQRKKEVGRQYQMDIQDQYEDF